MNAPENADQWVWLARIRRPQGRKGEVIADILTDFPEKFVERRRLWLLPETPEKKSGSSRDLVTAHPVAGPREAELVGHWLHKGSVVLHFAGIDSISDAEALAGMVVALPREERAPLAEDEIYIADLIGCTLVDVSGEAVAVGEIEDVDRAAGPVPLLVVRGAQAEILIPFAKSYLRKLDLEGRRIEMALPDGLIDLNAD